MAMAKFRTRISTQLLVVKFTLEKAYILDKISPTWWELQNASIWSAGNPQKVMETFAIYISRCT